MGLHRSLEAGTLLENNGISAEIIDLRSVAPLDVSTVVHSVEKTGRLLVADEDYRRFGLSGELAATVLEHSVHCVFDRVCTDQTIPFSHTREMRILPGAERITESAMELMRKNSR